jgi:hypothetical protein
MIIHRNPTPEQRARMAEGLHELAQHISETAEDRLLDIVVPVPTREDLIRLYGRP